MNAAGATAEPHCNSAYLPCAISRCADDLNTVILAMLSTWCAEGGDTRSDPTPRTGPVLKSLLPTLPEMLEGFHEAPYPCGRLRGLHHPRLRGFRAGHRAGHREARRAGRREDQVHRR